MSFENPRPSYEKSDVEKFEARFITRRVVSREETNVLDARPIRPKGDVPVMYAPGFSETLHTQGAMLKLLYDQDRRVIGVDHPRRGESFSNIPDAHLESSIIEFPRTELRKAQNLLELLETLNVGKTDCVAFSEGALNSVIAAYLRPDKFRTLVLIAPPGLIGMDSIVGLALRFQKQVKKNKGGIPSLTRLQHDEGIREKIETYVADTWEKEYNETLKKNLLRSMDEFLHLPSMRIDQLVQSIRKAGVKVIIVSGVDDHIFPAELMSKRLPKDSVDGFIAIQGAHGPHYIAHALDGVLESAAT